MKEKITNATIELINQSNGLVDKITIRKIAEKAGVGVGLVNYHFGTKENLINICVEKIINDVVKGYKPKIETDDEKEKTYITVKGVADYLWANREVSKISILSDFQNPKSSDNTMKSVNNFVNTTKSDKLKAFILVSALQTVFIRDKVANEFFGLNTDNKEERDRLMEDIVNLIVWENSNENSGI